MKTDDMIYKIDKIDSEIIELLSKRSSLMTASGTNGKKMNEAHDHNIEKAIMKIKHKASNTGLDPDIAEKIYRNIINCFKYMQMKEFLDINCEPQDI